jgi:hypothetical protein
LITFFGAGLVVPEISMNKKCRLICRSIRHPKLPPRKWWLRMGGAATLLGLLTLPVYEIQPPQTQWSGLGHGKRYLRINEYLFNGTQKVTAIAWQIAAGTADKTPV